MFVLHQTHWSYSRILWQIISNWYLACQMWTLSLIQNCSLISHCLVQIKQNRLTSNKRTDQRNLSQCRAMKAQVNLFICVSRISRAFASRIHKAVCRLKTKFNLRTLAPLHHHEWLNNAFSSPNIYLWITVKESKNIFHLTATWFILALLSKNISEI